MPSQHRSEIFYDQARVLLRLRSGGPINIGRVIFNAIQDASAHDDQSMVFPCLITAFCRQAGIDVSSGLENHDPTGGLGVEPQDFDQRTPILNFDDEQQMQDDTINSDQGTEILQLSDEDGGD
ncbi:hypothetical protein LWI29_014448 [Acer saccharum]|uniref:Putative plant transposon protein domain-containing protein n=1 Tax=Acer saccharum TaxID=4024 RepID=A0AA39SMH4_ACESA|nr:hypothetical protein LWI29_014448 [Acer saccharum]